MPSLFDLRDRARHVGCEAGRASAQSRGLDDWDDLALLAAETAERLYLARHWPEARQHLTDGD